MSRVLALGLLLALAACNRHGVADVTLDADAAQRNATAAKTLGDLAAADAASQGPAPAMRDAAPVKAAPAPEAAAAPADNATEAATPDESDEAPANN
jgi:hypothetical protein